MRDDASWQPSSVPRVAVGRGKKTGQLCEASGCRLGSARKSDDFEQLHEICGPMARSFSRKGPRCWSLALPAPAEELLSAAVSIQQEPGSPSLELQELLQRALVCLFLQGQGELWLLAPWCLICSPGTLIHDTALTLGTSLWPKDWAS